MTPAERALYHQIHPLKLLTDFTTSFASAWLLWEGRWLEGALVALLPSVVVTALLLWRADLDRYVDTPMGRYVVATMDRMATSTRAAGQVVMWIGAAFHVPWLLPLGFMVVVYGWLRGLWRRAP